MNAIRKAAFAASALAITVVGAAFATAPMAFARPAQIMAEQQVCATSTLQLALAGHVKCRRASPVVGLFALNRR